MTSRSPWPAPPWPAARRPSRATTGTIVSLDAGAYSVTETGPAGYNTTYRRLLGRLAPTARAYTCTINNNDNAATLTLVKTVTNDNGGTAVAADFTITVRATVTPADLASRAADCGTTVTLDAGTLQRQRDRPRRLHGQPTANCVGHRRQRRQLHLHRHQR